MGKQIKEYLALFKACIYTSLESVIHRTAVIYDGIVDILPDADGKSLLHLPTQYLRDAERRSLNCARQL